MQVLIVCLWIFAAMQCAYANIPKFSIDVQTTTGPIRGYREYTLFEQRPYYAFKGIPFAEPPLGRRRYLPPTPIKRWTAIRDCAEHGPICPQPNDNNTGILGNEDCLHLNVYTPSKLMRSNSQPLAIMVYIFGGGFFTDSGDTDMQGPDFLIDENVILVTLNHRLAILGFLHINNNPKYSGNAGLKDQQLAMQWAYDNAHVFGGDRTRITLFGLSSGSASTYFQMVGIGSEGLFQRAIPISITFDIWSTFNEPTDTIARLRSFMTDETGRQHFSNAAFMKFIQTVDMKKLLTRFPSKRYELAAHPRVESDFDMQPILVGTPDEIMFEASDFRTDIDVMTGYTTAEAITIITNQTFADFLSNGQIHLPSVHFNFNYDSLEYKEALKKIIDFYFVDELADNLPTFERYVQLLSDAYQRYFIDRKAKNLAAKSSGKTYYYKFGLDSPLNYYKPVYGYGHLDGACHGDDLCYVLRCGLLDDVYAGIKKGTQLHGLIKLMSGIYANFAKYGNPMPNSDWQPLTPNDHRLLEIGMNGNQILEDPLKEMTTFWKDLMDSYPTLFN